MHKHRKWKERIISTGLAVMMVISMFPARVSAAADVEVHTECLDFRNVANRIDDTCSNPHWTWNDKKDTLTLNRLNLDADRNAPAITLTDVTIVLKGQNIIKNKVGSLMSMSGLCKITGSGSFFGETQAAGIDSEWANPGRS